MTGTIQTGDAQVLSFTGKALSFTYSDAQVLILVCRTHSVYASYSEAGLQSETTRFKIQKLNDAASEGPDGLTIPFSTPSSGTLYFASANAGSSAILSMWSINCGSKNY